jgi:hypothetical protein
MVSKINRCPKLRWSRKVVKRTTMPCPKCQETATVIHFENYDNAYIRCYNDKCDCYCTNETFHRAVEEDIKK